MPGELLPIKVVFPSPADFQRPPTGGGDRTVFVPVTSEIRDRFVSEVAAVSRAFAQSFRRFPDVPAVAKVRLKREATAKSHRPSSLFNGTTCPVIGSTELGELLVSVTPQGLTAVSERIAHGQSVEAQANISALESIAPFSSADARNQTVGSSDTAGRVVTCRLFRHASAAANAAAERALSQVLQEAGGNLPEPVWYSDELRVLSLGEASEAVVDAVANFVGVQAVGAVPAYHLVRTESRVIGNLTPDVFPPPDPGARYGVVGLIDSGTDPNNRQLQAWVETRHEWVPRAQQQNDHGTFVAGLLVHSRRLNHQDDRFPAVSSRIVDVVAIDRDGQITETDLLAVIDDALARFPHVKVWNLSLSLAGDICNDWQFSPIGMALDARSKRYGVLFVVAAGNYDRRPLRGWPAEGAIGELDRIAPPADSVRALTVGSLAHRDSPNTRVRDGEPSPFSRRGPGPVYLIKPELTHYGGNCDQDGVCSQVGIISLNENGQLCENIGTSFATPLVSAVASSVHDELAVDPDSASPAMLKAMLVHSAFLRQVPLDPTRLNYFGLGTPADAAQIVSCRQSSATVVLQVPVTVNPHFVKEPFPLIAALEDEGMLRGEVFMTLVHDTPLDANFRVDYCRTNVTASLGTMRVDEETGEVTYPRQVGPVPKALTEGYEEDLVKHGFKWSPLKLYYRKLSRMSADKDWRLLVERLDRAENVARAAQQAILIITVRDPEGRLPVYDRVVQSINRAGWQSQDLQVRSRSRLQT